MKPVALAVGMVSVQEICIKALESFHHPTILLSRQGDLLKPCNNGTQLESSVEVSAVQVVRFEDGDEPAEVQAIRVATEMCLQVKPLQWSQLDPF